MDNLSDRYVSNVNRPGLFSAVLLTVQGIVRSLVEFFKLTEQDQLKAGIHLGGKGHDE